MFLTRITLLSNKTSEWHIKIRLNTIKTSISRWIKIKTTVFQTNETYIWQPCAYVYIYISLKIYFERFTKTLYFIIASRVLVIGLTRQWRNSQYSPSDGGGDIYNTTGLNENEDASLFLPSVKLMSVVNSICTAMWMNQIV